MGVRVVPADVEHMTLLGEIEDGNAVSEDRWGIASRCAWVGVPSVSVEFFREPKCKDLRR